MNITFNLSHNLKRNRVKKNVRPKQNIRLLSRKVIDLTRFEKKNYSQHGEDGITSILVKLLYGNDNTNKFYVEFGVENGTECNTRILREKYNWNGLQMDGSNENNTINLKREFITKENVVYLFKKYNVPHKINLLSVDIDFNDFYCLKEILKNYTCDIIICEYNGTHNFDEDKIIIYNEYGQWDYSNYFGASLLSFYKLANLYNYSLIYCDNSGTNCFFIRNDIVKERNINFINYNNISKLYKPPKYGDGPNGGHPHDKLNRQYITFEEALHI